MQADARELIEGGFSRDYVPWGLVQVGELIKGGLVR